MLQNFISRRSLSRCRRSSNSCEWPPRSPRLGGWMGCFLACWFVGCSACLVGSVSGLSHVWGRWTILLPIQKRGDFCWPIHSGGSQTVPREPPFEHQETCWFPVAHAWDPVEHPKVHGPCSLLVPKGIKRCSPGVS